MILWKQFLEYSFARKVVFYLVWLKWRYQREGSDRLCKNRWKVHLARNMVCRAMLQRLSCLCMMSTCLSRVSYRPEVSVFIELSRWRDVVARCLTVIHLLLFDRDIPIVGLLIEGQYKKWPTHFIEKVYIFKVFVRHISMDLSIFIILIFHGLRIIANLLLCQ